LLFYNANPEENVFPLLDAKSEGNMCLLWGIQQL